jgi:hypothetical protein
MRQYWAKHKGLKRWGVRTPLETGEEVYRAGDRQIFFVWADRVDLVGGVLLFRSEAGELQGALAPGAWEAVFEVLPDADVPQAVETR